MSKQTLKQEATGSPELTADIIMRYYRRVFSPYLLLVYIIDAAFVASKDQNCISKGGFVKIKILI